jgi:uncharacterized membrane protein YkoI
MKTTIAILALMLIVSASFGQKKHKAKISKEEATKIVLETVKGGTIAGSELEKEEGKLVWSFDVKSDSVIKEVWVDAATGAVIKTETESARNEKEEQISEKTEKAALNRVPGEVLKKEMKTEKGKTIYSFEIKTKKGKTVEVDVNAKTNKVIKIETEEEKKDGKEEKEDNE